MGHIRLGELPRTRHWIAVFELLKLDSSVEELAGATALAAERELQRASVDPAFEYTVWLITQLPLAARSSRFADELTALGFSAGADASVIALTGALARAIDEQAGDAPNRNDLGDLARQAAAESLTAFLTAGTGSLFESSSETLQRDLAALATNINFARLARDFFSRLTQKTLEYYLSRAIPNHFGTNRAFASIDDQIDFRIALEKHCREAAEIVEEFAGGWYSKTRHRGELTPTAAGAFGAYALKKIRDELRARRRGAHD